MITLNLDAISLEAKIQAIIKETIAETLRAINKANDPTDGLPYWLTYKETAKVIGVTEQTIRNWVKQGIIEKHYIGGTEVVRFKRDEVLALPKKNKRNRR